MPLTERRQKVRICFSLDLLSTLGQKSLLRLVSVCTKNILISGCVGGAVGVSHTSKLGTFFLRPINVCQFLVIYKKNGALGDTVFLKMQFLL